MDFSVFEKRIGLTFKNIALLTQAFTHRSYLNENRAMRMEHNERLEFLGDAILEFVVSEVIYNKFSDQEEGYLTALRAKIVNTVSLAAVAQKMDLGKHIFLSKGEEETGGRTNTSLLADTVESIIGAIFIDGGLLESRKFIENNILDNLDIISREPLKDPKSLLQEEVQSKGYPTPKYIVVKEAGPDHEKTFSFEVEVGGERLGTGTGKSKSEAAQNAAKDALTKSL